MFTTALSGTNNAQAGGRTLHTTAARDAITLAFAAWKGSLTDTVMGASRRLKPATTVYCPSGMRPAQNQQPEYPDAGQEVCKRAGTGAIQRLDVPRD